MAKPAFQDAADEIAREFDSDVLLYCGPITPAGDKALREAVAGRTRRRKNVALLLTTLGGSPDAAFRIARCLQRAYKDGSFVLLVDTLCKSAGTLIAIGATEIVMSDLAEFGPLDIQLQKPEDVFEFTSGLTTFQALKSLRSLDMEAFEEHFLRLRFGDQMSTKVAGEMASSIVAALHGRIYEQIDPMRIGEHARAMLVAEAYGERLGKERGAKKAIKAGALSKLMSAFPSHAFVIDRDEAADYFHAVRPPKPSEATFFGLMRRFCDGNITSQNPFVLYCAGEPPEASKSSLESKDEQNTPGSSSGEPGSVSPTRPADQKHSGDAVAAESG